MLPAEEMINIKASPLHYTKGMRLDTTYTINTPEGIALELSPAGPVPRTLAWIIDLSIRTAFNVVMFGVMAFLGNTGLGIGLIIMFLLEWFYPVWFELRHHGQTPGKKLLQIYVAQANATPITPAASVVRNLLRVADFLPFCYGFGLISTLLTQRFQRLGDLAANTVVLHLDPPKPAMQAFQALPAAPPLPLSLPEQQAIILFAQRQYTLTNERQDELAHMTGQLVANRQDASNYLKSIASWLTGQRS